MNIEKRLINYIKNKRAINMSKKYNQETIVNHLKNYGFVYANSEIYNGLSNTWDYGPLGVNLKNNLKKLWWKEFITKDKNLVGLDSMILLNPMVWQASGHLSNFSDPLIDCKNCKNRFRADKLIEEVDPSIQVSEKTTNDEIQSILQSLHLVCPNCHTFAWTEVRNFNLMFKTFQGTVENNSTEVYLRPETAQGIFINFKNVLRTTRAKLPLGIGQIGKSFRNEITPGNFIFRTREFEQMEIEFFCHEEQALSWFDFYLNKIHDFLTTACNLRVDNFKLKEHSKEELSHYSKRTVDYIYNFPHGWGELWGLAYRTDFDLQTHMEYSKKDLEYLDPITNQKYIPHVVEPSVGVERLMYAICCDAYDEEILADNDTRIVMHLNYCLAPYKVCVLPLTNKLKDLALEIFDTLLANGIECCYDAAGSIGKRYRRQDAIGTPYCLTVDFDSLENQTVSIRDRDSMRQVILKIVDLPQFFLKLN